MQFSDEDIYDAVKNYLPTVSEYVNSHGGGLDLLGVKNGVVYIALTGACGGCSMSLMTTKMVVQRKLRELIHPTLEVVNVDGTPENALPENVYKGMKKEELEEKKEEIHEEKHGILEGVKQMVGL